MNSAVMSQGWWNLHILNIIMYYNGKVCSLWGSTLPKIRITSKKLQIKVVQNWISYKKVRERICLTPPWVELDGSKDQYVWNLIIYRNWSLEALAPLVGQIDICACRLFCAKFNYKQLLFKVFFSYNAYFWQHWAPKWI